MCMCDVSFPCVMSVMHMCDMSCTCVMCLICCYVFCTVWHVLCGMTMCDLCVIQVNVICVMHVCEMYVTHVWSPVQLPTQDLASVMHMCLICVMYIVMCVSCMHANRVSHMYEALCTHPQEAAHSRVCNRKL